MNNVPNPDALPFGFLELLAENRELREQFGALREQLAWLVGRYGRYGRYGRDGFVPVEKIDALLHEEGGSDA